jgi:hypothetical protein
VIWALSAIVQGGWLAVFVADLSRAGWQPSTVPNLAAGAWWAASFTLSVFALFCDTENEDAPRDGMNDENERNAPNDRALEK